jgi:NAD(P)-dependent dehydrogenase (short-subunit alcohol dehydrogenase family)
MTSSLPRSGQVVLVAGATRGAGRGVARAAAAPLVGLGLRARKGGAAMCPSPKESPCATPFGSP